jgi:hypothetical protein
MSDKQRPTSEDHHVHYTGSGDPRASGVPTTGVPVNPTGKGAPEVLRHPNSGHYMPKGKR